MHPPTSSDVAPPPQQLYWNMINTSIQALNDMVNSFTRAAGAAERVLSLYDLTPDIDPNQGAPVDLAVRRWDIAFEDVHFHYQMRPQQKVLQGMSFRVDEGQVGDAPCKRLHP